MKNLVIIAGSRIINDYDIVENAIKESGFKIDQLVCGEAKGIDSVGKLYCANNDIPIKSFYPEWENLEKQPCFIKINKFGKKYNSLAGHNRNREMAQYATHLILIHCNTSGSLNMLKLAKEYNLIIFEKIVNIENGITRN